MSVVVGPDSVDVRELIVQPKGDPRRAPPPPIICYAQRPSGQLLVPLAYGIKKVGASNDHHDDVASIEGIRLRKSFELRPKQAEVVEQIKEALSDRRTATLNALCGFGKTPTALSLVPYYKTLTVVICPETTLIAQWHEAALKVLSGIRDRIWIVPAKVEEPPDDVALIICYRQRTHKIPKELRKLVGLLIVDECHLMNTATGIVQLAAFQPQYMFGLSGTLERRNGTECIMELYLGKRKIVVPMDKPHSFVRVQLPFSGEIRKIRDSTTGKELEDYTHLMSTVLANKTYVRTIATLAVKCVNQGRKVMIINPRCELVEKIAARIAKMGTTSTIYMGSSETYDGMASVLIGTPKKLSTGFDQDNSGVAYDRRYDVLISSMTIANGATLTQTLGRILRADTHPVFFWIEPNNEVFANQWIKMSRYGRLQLGSIIGELSIDEIEDSGDNLEKYLP